MRRARIVRIEWDGETGYKGEWLPDFVIANALEEYLSFAGDKIITVSGEPSFEVKDEN